MSRSALIDNPSDKSIQDDYLTFSNLQLCPMAIFMTIHKNVIVHDTGIKSNKSRQTASTLNKYQALQLNINRKMVKT